MENKKSLEQRLHEADFYKEFADKEEMLQKFMRRLNRPAETKEKYIKKWNYSAAIPAVILFLSLTAGTTIFASAAIQGLMKSIKTGQITANSYEEGVVLDEKHPDAAGILHIEDAGIPEEGVVLEAETGFASFEEAAGSLTFTPFIPVYSGHTGRFRVFETMAADSRKTIFTYVWSTSENSSAFCEVNQQHVGEQELIYDTAADVFTVTINGIEAAASIHSAANSGDMWNGTLLWVQNGYLINMNFCGYTYQQAVKLAESMVLFNSEEYLQGMNDAVPLPMSIIEVIVQGMQFYIYENDSLTLLTADVYNRHYASVFTFNGCEVTFMFNIDNIVSSILPLTPLVVEPVEVIEEKDCFYIYVDDALLPLNQEVYEKYSENFFIYNGNLVSFIFDENGELWSVNQLPINQPK